MPTPKALSAPPENHKYTGTDLMSAICGYSLVENTIAQSTIADAANTKLTKKATLLPIIALFSKTPSFAFMAA